MNRTASSTGPTTASSGTRLRERVADLPVRGLDRAVAVVLGLVYVVVLLLTMDIGYTRDESYYFRFGRVYQDWFTAVATDLGNEGEARSLQREAVVRTWAQNFEHPPLMKVLFGFSWRLLGEKHRPLGAFGTGQEGAGKVTVRDLGESDGFQVGDEVWLLPPQAVDAADVADGALAGTVIARKKRSADVEIAASTEAVDRLRAACADARKGPPVLRPCRAAADSALAVLSEGNATRFPALLFAGGLIGLIYLFGVRIGGRWVGGFAAIAFAALPRGFFHAHLAAFDVPVAMMVFATCYAFWRSQWSRRWAYVTGVVWGVALLTKHNAFFIPVFLVVYWAWAHRQEFGIRKAMTVTGNPWMALAVAAVLVVGATLLSPVAGVVVAVLVLPILARRNLVVPALPRAFWLMPLIGVPMLFLLWPKLWFDPFRALVDYLSFHLSHEHYMQYYFGNILEVPPFPVSHPFVMTLLTVPVLTLAAFGLGAATLYGPAAATLWTKVRRRARGGDERSPQPSYARRVRVFLAVNMLLPILLIAMPSTPIFGGVKHWLPAMPFFALIAGLGFDWARRALVGALGLRRRWMTAGLSAALLMLMLLPAVSETARAHPFGTAYYNQLVGGVQGAADLRMHRQFWGYASRQALDRLNHEARRGASVFFQNTTHDAYDIYRRDGLLRQDIRHAWGIPSADYALFHHQKSFAELERDMQHDMHVSGPAWQVTYEGVPMLSVYRKPQPTQGDGGSSR